MHDRWVVKRTWGPAVPRGIEWPADLADAGLQDQTALNRPIPLFPGKQMKQNIFHVLAVCLSLLAVFQSAHAFPDRPIKLVVPSAAGSPPDMMARLLSDRMAADLGQPVIVENRIGAGGTIGAKSVLMAEPDGHTLMVGTTRICSSRPWSTKTSATMPERSRRLLAFRTARKFWRCIPRSRPNRSRN